MPVAEPVRMLVTCNGCNRILQTTATVPSPHIPDYRICFACWDANIRTCVSCGIHGTSYSQNEITRSMGISNYITIVTADDSESHICLDCSHYCDNCENRYEYESSWADCCIDTYSDDQRWVHDYSYRPGYLFYSDVPETSVVSVRGFPNPYKLYMGFEIELARVRGLMKDFYDIANESYNTPEFMYAKYDASIGSDGVEFVTMPATLRAFELKFPWQAFEWMHLGGARGWAYESCGMHIHVSRSAFTPSHLYKFMKFQSANDSLCIEFAGRSSNFARWDNESMEKIRLNTKEYLNNGVYAERYSAINVTPRNTIELRYFRSNITKNGILRNAQWVDAIYQYTKQMNILGPRLNRWNYEPFIEFLHDKPQYSLALEHVRKVWS